MTLMTIVLFIAEMSKKSISVCLWFIRLLTSLFVFLTLPLCQVQIQEQQGQTVGQVLQVAHPSQQDIQGISTAQLVQAGELTEEQQQQVED